MEDARWPTLEEVESVLYVLAAGQYGTSAAPFPAFSVQDVGLLESALGLPHQTWYESFYDKLAAMVRSIAANHALEDGNKRLALTMLHTTLLVNGYLFTWDDDVAEQLMLRVATGDDDYQWLAEFIEMWTDPPTSDGDRVPFEDPEMLRATLDSVRGVLQRRLPGGRPGSMLAHLLIRAHAMGQLSAPDIQSLKARLLGPERT